MGEGCCSRPQLSKDAHVSCPESNVRELVSPTSNNSSSFSSNTSKGAYESSSKKLKLDPAEETSNQEESDCEQEEELDIMSIDKIPDLPYDESKVRSVMVECEKYVSLVRLVAKHHHQEEMCVSLY